MNPGAGMSAGMSQSVEDPNHARKELPDVGMVAGNCGNARGVSGVKSTLTREG